MLTSSDSAQVSVAPTNMIQLDQYFNSLQENNKYDPKDTDRREYSPEPENSPSIGQSLRDFLYNNILIPIIKNLDPNQYLIAHVFFQSPKAQLAKGKFLCRRQQLTFSLIRRLFPWS